uniref:Reverse transcriptase domain-containing protein n=1 Tax=Panagrellus redivivus TaxID=6233 RepID=A0A7E4UXE9_PANRE
MDQRGFSKQSSGTSRHEQKPNINDLAASSSNAVQNVFEINTTTAVDHFSLIGIPVTVRPTPFPLKPNEQAAVIRVISENVKAGQDDDNTCVRSALERPAEKKQAELIYYQVLRQQAKRKEGNMHEDFSVLRSYYDIVDLDDVVNRLEKSSANKSMIDKEIVQCLKANELLNSLTKCTSNSLGLEFRYDNGAQGWKRDVIRKK